MSSLQDEIHVGTGDEILLSHAQFSHQLLSNVLALRARLVSLQYHLGAGEGGMEPSSQ